MTHLLDHLVSALGKCAPNKSPPTPTRNSDRVAPLSGSVSGSESHVATVLQSLVTNLQRGIQDTNRHAASLRITYVHVQSIYTCTCTVYLYMYMYSVPIHVHVCVVYQYKYE